MEEEFTDQIALDPIEKITAEADMTLGLFAGALEVVTKDGRKFYRRIDVPRGMGNNILNDKEVEGKVPRHGLEVINAIWEGFRIARLV